MVLKFHDNLTINEFGIIVLLRQFWIYTKKIAPCEGYFSQHTLFHKSGIVILDMFECMRKKEFWERKKRKYKDIKL